MSSFGTGGTPWSVVIDRNGRVRFSAFTPADVTQLVRWIERLRNE